MGSHRRKIMRTSYTIEFLITHQFCSGSHDVQRDLKWGNTGGEKKASAVCLWNPAVGTCAKARRGLPNGTGASSQ